MFFLLARLLERSRWGGEAIGALNRVTAPVWLRQDDYIRAIIAAFFIAIFSVGNVYLTPDLKTPHEWVSWLQLVIAFCRFWRATMPLAGLSIVVLWVFALRDYELFHLFDYLALGLGVAAYLTLEPLKNEKLRARRFEALRWGLAIALMWSSLEKFAFPDWCYPLVLEKPSSPSAFHPYNCQRCSLEELQQRIASETNLLNWHAVASELPRPTT